MCVSIWSFSFGQSTELREPLPSMAFTFMESGIALQINNHHRHPPPPPHHHHNRHCENLSHSCSSVSSQRAGHTSHLTRPVSNSPLTRPWRVKLVTLYRQLDKTTFTYISTNRTLSRVEYAFTVPMLFVVVVVVFVFDCQVDVDVDNVQRRELVNVYRVQRCIRVIIFIIVFTKNIISLANSNYSYLYYSYIHTHAYTRKHTRARISLPSPTQTRITMSELPILSQKLPPIESLFLSPLPHACLPVPLSVYPHASFHTLNNPYADTSPIT